jgi:hypothetical protein
MDTDAGAWKDHPNKIDWFLRPRESFDWHGRGTLLIRCLAFVMAFALIAASCTDTEPGYNLQGMNASSEDVIVSFGTSSGGSFLLPLKTWGTISSGHSKPTGDIVVSDLNCKEKARIPWTQADSTLRIASDGSIGIAEGHQTFPPGVQPVTHVEGGPLSSIGPC